jgi:hypothetical protein
MLVHILPIAAYVPPIIAFAILLAVIFRDAERYKTRRPSVEMRRWPPFGESPGAH